MVFIGKVKTYMKNQKRNFKGKYMGKLKGLPVGLIVLLVASMLVAGAFLTFFVRVDVETQVDGLIEYGEVPVEDYVFTKSYNGVPGNTYSYTAELELNANSQNNVTIRFRSTNQSEVINYVTILGVQYDTYTLVPGCAVDCTIHTEILANATSGTYLTQMFFEYA